RQTLRYGNERLVGRADWGNVGRRFDAARLTYQSKRAKLDWFAATLTPSIRGGFDRFETDQRLFGFYAAFPELFAGAELQPFVFMKRAPGVDVVASGARVVGKLPARLDYSGEAVFETGDVLGEDLRAWAGYAIIGRTVGGGKRAPRVYAEYAYASGDGVEGDGRSGSFDQLYPTNHGKYGIADRMGWRNMHGLRGGITVPAGERWRLQLDYHSFWLASLADFLYRSNGTPIVRNPGASSRHVHQEIDLQGVVTVAGPLELLFGYAHVFPGAYLRESSPGSSASYAYGAFRLTL
ncbi:MAG: alginate export family protein, partial [bacterium]|nr:alginate export family protein [bacterium]